MNDREALDKIVEVMREKGVPDDITLSEIQDFLTMAGYDVPLRTYRTGPEPEIYRCSIPWHRDRGRIPPLPDAAIDAFIKEWIHGTRAEFETYRDQFRRAWRAAAVPPCPHCLSPEDSAVIAREIREGTPDTPERIEFMRRADAAYAKTAAERCSICERVAFFKCPKCGVEWYNRIQSLASSQEHDA